MPREKSKPRLALFAMGIMGGGSMGQGIPVLHDLFRRLADHYSIIFYCFQSIDKSKVPSSIIVKQVVSVRIPGRLKFLLLLLTFSLDHIRNPFRLIFSIAIYPTGKAAITAGKIFKIPVIVQIIALEAVALWDIGYGNLTKPWLKKVTQEVCEKADVLVTVADYQSKLARSSLPTSRSITMLPLRIDPKNFTYRKRNISFPVQIVNIGYYGPIKDQDTTFKAFARISKQIDCHLTMIGEGFDSPKIHSLINELKIADKVTFTGFIKNIELPRYLDSAHILLHTARFETGCAVIQEAMASGIVVGGTDVGILSDIGDEYAIIVPQQDATQLADKILDVIHDPIRYQKIQNAAYQFITTYDAVWSYENYKAFLDKMLEEKIKKPIQA